MDASVSRHAATAVAGRNAVDGVVKIDLDERAFVFPQHKSMQQLQLHAIRPNTIRFEALYAFNQNRASPVLFALSSDDAAELARRLVEAVYRAQSSQVVSSTASLSITVVANGYILTHNDPSGPTELFLGSGCIWRVCGGIARAVDFLSPIASN
jgi:hypothetical protein